MPYTKVGVPAEQLEIESELRAQYGGMMTKSDIAAELGISRPIANQWLEDVPGVKVVNRIKYRVRDVARKIYRDRKEWVYQ